MALKVIGALLVLWLVVTVIGAVVKALFWLAVMGAVLVVATAVLGVRRRHTRP
ncbi:hypothetical protein [Trujillonella humicola]|uniref:hypothetical protein n=1 Tax=Trujillonella humicola TaxID=3383699 RepID=UPI003906C280